MAPERPCFKDLSSIVSPDEAIPHIGIRACHKVRAEDEHAFVSALLEAHMAVLVAEDELPRHPHTGQLLKGGCFGVAHTHGRQRLIYGRRALNECEADLSPEWLWPPHGTRWADMLLEPADCLRAATADLSNWFYNLHSGNWHRRQAIGRREPGDVFAASHGTVLGRQYRCCLRGVALGEKKGVLFAQE